MTHLLRYIDTSNSESNKQRYIHELKERNLVLVKINQFLDSKLDMKVTHVNSFSEIKAKIYSKLEMLSGVMQVARGLRELKIVFDQRTAAIESKSNHFLEMIAQKKMANKKFGKDRKELEMQVVSLRNDLLVERQCANVHVANLEARTRIASREAWIGAGFGNMPQEIGPAINLPTAPSSVIIL
jgi:hypothetical protein